MKYTYQLHKGEKTTHALYSREELERLTTLQLKDCNWCCVQTG